MIKLTQRDVISLLPERADDSHKGSHGTLLSICGSSMYRGAAVLSSLGALRCGVGILRLCSVEGVISVVAARLPEATYLPVNGDDKGFICGLDYKATLESFKGITACLCGCGLGKTQATADLVKQIVSETPFTLVLDADALNIISENTEVLKNAVGDIIITPHLGEFSRLTKREVADIKNNREKYALEFAGEYGVTVVLKDSDTVIATPNGESFISCFGNSGLARGGSGDILAGMIASFAAQGLDCKNAAILGVGLQGMAADICAKRRSKRGMLPSEITDCLTEIFLKYER